MTFSSATSNGKQSYLANDLKKLFFSFTSEEVDKFEVYLLLENIALDFSLSRDSNCFFHDIMIEGSVYSVLICRLKDNLYLFFFSFCNSSSMSSWNFFV